MLVKKNKTRVNRIVVMSIFAVLTAIFCFSFLLNTAPVLAQGADLLYGGQEGNISNTIGLGSEDPRIIIARVIRVFIGFLGIIALFVIMYSGWMWMTSEGSPDKVDLAKKILKNGLIGLIIILTSFGITSFLINRLYNATGGGLGPGGGPPPQPTGLGVIGSCTVESTYPEPFQKDVPRNISIIVTFKEEVQMSTICNGDYNDDGDCTDNISPGVDELINPDRVRIYKTNVGDSCGSPNNNCSTSNVINVQVDHVGNKTFVFTLRELLGSPSENISYTVYMSEGINKLYPSPGLSPGIFSTCDEEFLKWRFEVSNRIDLDPPIVKNGGIFPNPDNDMDNFMVTTPSIQASGQITVLSQPDVYSTAMAGPGVAQAAHDDGVVIINNDCTYSGGILSIDTDSTDLSQAVLFDSASNMLGSGPINGNSVAFSYCDLNFSIDSGDFVSNCSGVECLWDINITPMVPATTLTVGSIQYEFGADIPLGGDTTGTAVNIASAITDDLSTILDAFSSGNLVDLTADIAGTVGNNISLFTSSSTLVEITRSMSGGLNSVTATQINGMKDQPRNSVIKINFNEAINPMTVSGNADDVSGALGVIKVINNLFINNQPCSQDGECASEYCASGTGTCDVCPVGSLTCTPGSSAPALKGDTDACLTDRECLSFNCDVGGTDNCVNDYLAGRFEISNQYKTVEFISDDLCGINGCGENIYCLPENSNIKVEIRAATLVPCVADTDCALKAPYSTCPSGVCVDPISGNNHPLSDFVLYDGVMDTALNSLDGNRDGNAQGPSSAYCPNVGDSSFGDNFEWSFYVSDVLDLNPPFIDGINPTSGGSGASLLAPVDIDFNSSTQPQKLMMSSSLRTGEIKIKSGTKTFTHRYINIKSYSGHPMGYWISSTDEEDSTPPDIYPDYTIAHINHSSFLEATGYKTQVGSGVKDIYQNCFKPSEGMTCNNTTIAQPSCCDLAEQANCPTW